MAMTCPQCGRPAMPAPAAQACPSCLGIFALYPGAASDPSIVPPPPSPALEIIQVRSAGAATYSFGAVEPFGVAEGMLDPVIAASEVSRNGIAWPEIASIAVWRKLDVFELVIAILVPVPLALLGWVLTISAGIGAIFLALPFTALAAFMIFRAVVRKKHFVRVVGRWGAIQIRFDRPGWKRERFHAELLRRAGLPNAPIP